MWEIRPFQSLRLWWNRLISMAVICCQARAIPLTVDEPVSSGGEEMETGFDHFCTVSLLTIFLSKLQTHELFFYMHPFTLKHHWTLLILLDFVTVGYTRKVWKCSTKRMGWEGLMRGTGEKKKKKAWQRRDESDWTHWSCHQSWRRFPWGLRGSCRWIRSLRASLKWTKGRLLLWCLESAAETPTQGEKMKMKI